MRFHDLELEKDVEIPLRDGAHLPLNQPYNGPPFNYAGTESVGARACGRWFLGRPD